MDEIEANFQKFDKVEQVMKNEIEIFSFSH
jgi:hypothetical protein